MNILCSFVCHVDQRREVAVAEKKAFIEWRNKETVVRAETTK